MCWLLFLCQKFQLPTSRSTKIGANVNNIGYTNFQKHQKDSRLSANHKISRENWAGNRHFWTPLQWGSIVFSDENISILMAPMVFNTTGMTSVVKKTFMSKKKSGEFFDGMGMLQ